MTIALGEALLGWFVASAGTRLLDLAGPPHRVAGLPGVTPGFTGRAPALADLAAHIAAHDPDGTVETIIAVRGMAGVGKTQLARRTRTSTAIPTGSSSWTSTDTPTASRRSHRRPPCRSCCARLA